ncbi:MAG: hypothetical protein QM489_00425 [Candidatus Izemoplasma sp.]
MSDFLVFKKAIDEQFQSMAKGKLFVTATNKDLIMEKYLKAFKPEDNPIYIERTVHDCQCCKQFLRAIGNVVSIVNNKKVSIFDIPKMNNGFDIVAKALSKYVRSKEIRSVFLFDSKKAGTDFNHQLLENNSVKQWDHFFVEVPNQFVNTNGTIGPIKSKAESGASVARRGLEEITMYALDTTIDLINQKSIYRGAEFLKAVKEFRKHKIAYDKIKTNTGKEHYAWANNHLRTRNTAIGTLLQDISKDTGLDAAVHSFGSKMEGYKRVTAIVTPLMISNAEKKAKELGILNSLQRRYAREDDLTINNVLFANHDAQQAMNAFDELKKEAKVSNKSFSTVEEVPIEDFIKNILPTAVKIELMVENSHSGNLVSLIAPENKDSKNMLRWGNNFTWSYNGEVTDSIKQRVKSAGGKIDAFFRFSIQWNDGDNNKADFDAHALEPNRNLISYPKKQRRQASSGMLDVDIVNPGNKVAVENITWDDKRLMPHGDYVLKVHCYSKNASTTGFTAQLELDGEILDMSYDRALRQGERVEVAIVNWDGSRLKIVRSLHAEQMSKEVWNIGTNNFHNVSMVMNSPNHWDGEETGNKHYFFMLEDCLNDDQTRGFYNEFLSNDLTEHRKVFEMLSSKMKVAESNDQLSGLGFSSTINNHVIAKVTGTFNRTIKIIF